jgi:uncharacterized protein involved in outer membrane biogenesis
LVVLAALGATGLTMLGRFDLARAAAGFASNALGRNTKIGSLKIQAGTSSSMELRDLVIDNVAGASQPWMLKVSRLDTEITSWSLLNFALFHRAPVVTRLSVDGVRLLLEHGPDDRPNWHFDGQPTIAADPAAQRARFPTMFDAHARDVEISLRTSSGQLLRMSAADASMTAAGSSEKIVVTGTGAYNDTPLRLTAALQSFDQFHDVTVPVGAQAHAISGDTSLDFTGTMTDPLNADGAAGQIVLNAANLNAMLAAAGINQRVDMPVALQADVTRSGDLWRMTGGRGTLRGQAFEATSELREGARRAPDNLKLDADFSVLDFSKLDGPGKSGETALRIDAEPGTFLDAHIIADQLLYNGSTAEHVDLAVKLEPGALTVEHLTFNIAGGEVHAEASVKNSDSGADLHFGTDVTNADTNRVFDVLGVGRIGLSGAADAHVLLDISAKTVAEALRKHRGTVLVTMRNGTIERKLIELASTDLRLLLRSAEGTARIACVLGVIELRDGRIRITPLRIRTNAGTVTAGGTFDPRSGAIDVTVASESASTGLFALDVPVRISGSIRDPRVLPVLGGSGLPGTIDLRPLAPSMRDFARGNACVAVGR